MDIFPYPVPFESPVAEGQEAILSSLEPDERSTDVMELEGRLYESEDIPLRTTRKAIELCQEAGTLVSVLQT